MKVEHILAISMTEISILPDELLENLVELEKLLDNFKTEVQSPEQVLITLRSPLKSFLAYVTVGVFVHELESPSYALTLEAYDVKRGSKLEQFAAGLAMTEGHGVTQLSVMCKQIAASFKTMDDNERCAFTLRHP